MLLDSGLAAGIVETCTFQGPIKGMADESTGEIKLIYLAPEKYWTGLGTVLFEFALNMLKKNGKIKVCVWVFEPNERAIHFYTKHGLAPTGEKKIHPPTGLPLLLFSKSLEA